MWHHCHVKVSLSSDCLSLMVILLFPLPLIPEGQLSVNGEVCAPVCSSHEAPDVAFHSATREVA